MELTVADPVAVRLAGGGGVSAIHWLTDTPPAGKSDCYGIVIDTT